MIRLAPLALLASLACTNTTGGALIVLPFSAGGLERADGGSLSFTTASGWAVTLEEAREAIGPFYFNVSPPQTGALQGGLVIVQVTAQTVVDVLDPMLRPVVAGANGQTGTAVAVEIGLLPPDESQSVPDVELLGTGVAYVRGTASQAATSVPFAGVVAIDLSLATPQNPPAALQRVNGASVSLTFEPSGQALTLRIDPTTWFDTADFAPLLQGTPVNGYYGWDVGSSFNQAVLTGLRQTSGVYGFALVPR